MPFRPQAAVSTLHNNDSRSMLTDGPDTRARTCFDIPELGIPDCCLPCPKQNFFYRDGACPSLPSRSICPSHTPRLVVCRVPDVDPHHHLRQPGRRCLLLLPAAKLCRAARRSHPPPLSQRLSGLCRPLDAGASLCRSSRSSSSTRSGSSSNSSSSSCSSNGGGGGIAS